MFRLKAKSKHICDSRCKKGKCPVLKKDEPLVPSKRIAKSIPVNVCDLCGEIRLWKPLPIQVRHKKFNTFTVGTTQISDESIKPEVKGSDRPGLTNSLTEIKELFNRPARKGSQQSVNSKKLFPAVQCENFCYCPCPYQKIPR